MRPEKDGDECPSRFWKPEHPVVSGRPIAAGFQGTIPIFGNDIWDLNCISYAKNVRSVENIIDFREIVRPKDRLLVKEFAMHRLNMVLPSHRSGKRRGRVKVSTLVSDLNVLRRLQTFMETRGVSGLRELDNDALNAFKAELEVESSRLLRHRHSRGATGSTESAASTNDVLRPTVTPQTRLAHLQVLDRLHDLDHHLTDGGLSFAPWAGERLADVVGFRPSSENETARIAEEVMGPLLAWSLAFVRVFSGDLLRAAELVAGAKAPLRVSARQADLVLDEWAASLADAGRCVPMTRHVNGTGIAVRRIGEESGLPSSVLYKKRERLLAIISSVGASSNCYGIIPLTLPGAAMGWCEVLDEWTFYQHCRNLVTACYIVVAFLSGMRDSEVQGLQAGCVGLSSEPGIAKFWVKGLVVKQSDDPTGDEHEWVVAEEVVEAIGVLERLTAALAGGREGRPLFIHLDGQSRGLTLAGSIRHRLQSFMRDIDRELAPRAVGVLPRLVKDPDGRSVTPSRFRRTLAWYIFNRPGGMLAGMRQFKHRTVQVFEGYAGNRSPSGFRAEAMAERLILAQKDIVDIFEEHGRGVRQAGPMGTELELELEEITRDLGQIAFAGRIEKEKARDERLKHLVTRLHPGLLVDCFFIPGRAKCLSRSTIEGDVPEPIVGLCDPNCRNACWREKHLPALKANLDDVIAMRSRRWNRESRHQKAILARSEAGLRSRIQDIEGRRDVR